MLLYVALALFVSNLGTGYLLKRAYDENVRATLECNNSKLQEALAANEAVTAALREAQQERDAERDRRLDAEVKADAIIASRVAKMQEAHAEEIENLRAEIDAIPEDEIQCASRPVSAGPLAWMRDRARGYNQDRDRDSHERSAVTDTETSPTTLPSHTDTE